MENEGNLNNEEQNDSYINEIEDKPSFLDSIKNFFTKQKTLPPGNNQPVKTTMFSVDFLSGFNRFKNSVANIGEIASKMFSGNKEIKPQHTMTANVISSNTVKETGDQVIDNIKETPIIPKVITKQTIKSNTNINKDTVSTAPSGDTDSGDTSSNTLKVENINIDSTEIKNQFSPLSISELKVDDTEKAEKDQNKSDDERDL